jgi:hypothetical protein
MAIWMDMRDEGAMEYYITGVKIILPYFLNLRRKKR